MIMISPGMKVRCKDKNFLKEFDRYPGVAYKMYDYCGKTLTCTEHIDSDMHPEAFYVKENNFIYTPELVDIIGTRFV